MNGEKYFKYLAEQESDPATKALYLKQAKKHAKKAKLRKLQRRAELEQERFKDCPSPEDLPKETASTVNEETKKKKKTKKKRSKKTVTKTEGQSR